MYNLERNKEEKKLIKRQMNLKGARGAHTGQKRKRADRNERSSEIIFFSSKFYVRPIFPTLLNPPTGSRSLNISPCPYFLSKTNALFSNNHTLPHHKGQITKSGELSFTVSNLLFLYPLLVSVKIPLPQTHSPKLSLPSILCQNQFSRKISQIHQQSTKAYGRSQTFHTLFQVLFLMKTKSLTKKTHL